MRFRLRLILSISLLIALAFGIGGSMLISASFQASLREEQTAALDSCKTVRNTLYLLNSLGENHNYGSLSAALEQMSVQGIARWQALTLTAPDEILYRSGNAALLSAQLPEPKEGQWVYTAVHDEYGHGLQVLSVISAGTEQLRLEARFDLSTVYATRETQMRLYLIIYLTVVLLGILTAVALSFAMTRQLRKLTTAVRKIAGGDLTTRCAITSPDEFGQLSRDFDAMADTIQENIGRLAVEMQRQEAFMGAFAHELKTPMTAIIGYADLLRQGGLDEDTRMMAANYIFSEGQRLEKLSFKLLDLLLLEKDDPVMRPVSLPDFLREVERALAPTLKEKDIQLVCRGDRGKAVLEPDLVKSLLYNLVDNAAKAMDTSGVIGIKGSLIPGGCQFQVVDNGRGMEEKELSRITEAFYRVDKSRSRKQGGAGLGLALCKQIVRLHHGSMKYISQPGTGTRVTVTLYGKEGKNHE